MDAEAMDRTGATRFALLCAGFLAGLWVLLLGTPQAAHATPLFTECSAIGSDAGCKFLITLNPGGTATVTQDLTQGPFGSSDDVLVGVKNSSGSTVSSLFLSSSSDILDFDGNGLCTATPHPIGCPFGTFGYAGPNTAFAGRNSAHTQGNVNFTGGLALGGTAYFSLEDPSSVSASWTPSPVPEPSTLILFGSALLGLPGLRRLIA